MLFLYPIFIGYPLISLYSFYNENTVRGRGLLNKKGIVDQHLASKEIVEPVKEITQLDNFQGTYRKRVCTFLMETRD